MNVLIIDDDVEDTELFCEALKEISPHAVCTVSNSCKDIPSLVRSLPPQDYIFVDGHMYPVSGIQCIIELLKTIDPQQTKIIIHTGSLSPMESIEFVKLGANEIVRKAHGFEDLKTNLKRIFS